MATTIYGTMNIPFKSGGPLPLPKNNREHYAPGSGIYTRFSDNAAQIAGQGAITQAQALRPLAEGIDRLGRFALDYADMENAKDMAAAQEAVARLQIEGQERRTSLSMLKGRDAVGVGDVPGVEDIMKKWGERAKQRYAQNLGPNGSQYFNLHADQFLASQNDWATSHQRKEFDRYRKKELELAIDAESNNIAQDPFNEEQVSHSLGRVRGLVEQNGYLNGWSPEMMDEYFNATRGKAFKKAISAQVLAGNIDGAQQLLQRHGGELDINEALSLKKHLATAAFQLIREHLANGDTAAAEQVYQTATATSKNVTALDTALGASTKSMGGTSYKIGAKDPGSGSVDCSGWVAHALMEAGHSGYDGLNSEQQTLKAMKTGRAVSLGEAKKHPRGGLVIGLDQGQRAHDKGREYGIDHVVVTYRDSKSGKVMVSEASVSKGVHGVPFDRWVAYHEKRGHKFFIGDVGGGSSASDTPMFNKAQQMGARRAIDDTKVAQRVESGFEKFKDNPLGGVEYYSNPANLKKEGIPPKAGEYMVDVFKKREDQRVRDVIKEERMKVDARLSEAFELAKTDPAAAAEMVARDTTIPDRQKKRFIKQVTEGGVSYNPLTVGDLEETILGGRVVDETGFRHIVVNGIVDEKTGERLKRHQNAVQSPYGQYYRKGFEFVRQGISRCLEQLNPGISTKQSEEAAKLALLKLFEDSAQGKSVMKDFDVTDRSSPLWKILDQFTSDLQKEVIGGGETKKPIQEVIPKAVPAAKKPTKTVAKIEEEIMDGKKVVKDSGLTGPVAKRLARHEKAVDSKHGQEYSAAFNDLLEAIEDIKKTEKPAGSTTGAEENAKEKLLDIYENALKKGTVEMLFSIDNTTDHNPVLIATAVFRNAIRKDRKTMKGKAYTYVPRPAQLTAGQRGIESWVREQVDIRRAREANKDEEYE